MGSTQAVLCVCLFDVTRESFTVPPNLCLAYSASPSPAFGPLAPTDLFMVFLRSLFQDTAVTQRELYSRRPFLADSVVKCTSDSSMSSVALSLPPSCPSFLPLPSLPFLFCKIICDCMVVSHFVHHSPTEEQLHCFQVVAITRTVAVNICAQVFTWGF